jgi:hypothetical protein
MADIWSDRTFDKRVQLWRTAFDIMNNHPLFGTGPDGYARFFSEFRPQAYVKLAGPDERVSAAHNVALQFGATSGWPGLILWAAVFGSVALLLTIRIVRLPVASISLTSSVSGAFAAYLTQGMVSIDVAPLLVSGWLVTGLAIALGREPSPPTPGTPHDAVASRSSRKATSPTVASALDHPQGSRRVLASGAVLGLAGAILVGTQLATANAFWSSLGSDDVLASMKNPLMPCPLRFRASQQAIGTLPAKTVQATIDQATSIDPRCPAMIVLASDASLRIGSLPLADTYTAESLALDPLLDIGWVLRGYYYLAIGDLGGAKNALREAKRLQDLYPKGARDRKRLKGLKNQLQVALERHVDHQ